MRILLTGFEPFGDHDYNPSWDVAQAAADALDDAGLEAEARRLAVTYASAAGFAAEHLGERPTLLVHVGLAARRAEVCFERYAHNGRTPSEAIGEDTQRAAAVPIVAGGPASLRCGLPLDDWARAWNEAGPVLPAVVSTDCGDYVCNATLWASLSTVEAKRAAGGRSEAVFVHVPAMDAAQARLVGARLADVVRAWANSRSGPLPSSGSPTDI